MRRDQRSDFGESALPGHLDEFFSAGSIARYRQRVPLAFELIATPAAERPVVKAVRFLRSSGNDMLPLPVEFIIIDRLEQVGGTVLSLEPRPPGNLHHLRREVILANKLQLHILGYVHRISDPSWNDSVRCPAVCAPV